VPDRRSRDHRLPRGGDLNDMPDGGPRFVSRAEGIRWSFVGSALMAA
jgi:hypothetical protein